MLGSSQKHTNPPAIEVLQQIKEFLGGCRRAVALEAGEKPVAIEQDSYALEVHGRDCVLHVWGEQGNVVRRVTAVKSKTANRLELKVRRFGGKQTTLSLTDRARKGEGFERQVEYFEFRENLRRILRRDFHEWQISRLSCAADLENSLSPVYTRAALSRGQTVWAAIGCSGDHSACDQVLTAGLIWLDMLRRQSRKQAVAGLKIFLPYSYTRPTANRLAFLNRDLAQFELYGFDAQGGLRQVDPADYGNLITELPPCAAPARPSPPVAAWVERVRSNPAVEVIPRGDGLQSLRVSGVEFARAGKGVMTYGLEEQTAVTEQRLPQVVALARELGRFRSAEADPQNPLYRRSPESWLESQVRRNIGRIDSRLRRSPVYSQIPAVAGIDRGVVDLLACDGSGRLAVLELKASEDMHLPLQGLDYWMRVHWHLDRGEFASRGYFPSIELAAETPRLLLVSPAFDFHPTTEIILKYLSPEVAVERVGVGADWRRELQVAFRKEGAGRLA